MNWECTGNLAVGKLSSMKKFVLYDWEGDLSQGEQNLKTNSVF